MKNRICLYTRSFDWVQSYRQMVDIAQSCGVSAIECLNDMEFSLPSLEEARRLRDYADARGISVACFSVFADLGGDRREELLKLEGYARVAAALGAPYLHHTVAPAVNDPRRENFEKQYRNGLKAVREIFDYAKTLGVKAVYEDQGYVFNGVAGLNRFFSEVCREVGFVLDLGNICQVDETAEALVAAFKGRVDHVHIKDAACSRSRVPGWLDTLGGGSFDCRRPGEGELDLAGCISAIEAAGYRGYYALEFDAGSGGMEALRAQIAQVAAWIGGRNC